MTAGLYQIRNVADGARYVGSSVVIHSRFSAHSRMLLKGSHHSVFLQRAWNKYGSDSFVFEPLCELPKDDLKEAEGLLIAMLFDSRHKAYNVSKDPTSPMRGLKHTDEWKQKAMGWKRGNKSRTGIPGHWKGKSLSADHIANIAKAKSNVSAETRAKMRAARLGVSPGNKGKYQSHCKHGHEMTDENTHKWMRKEGNMKLLCRACMTIRSKNHALMRKGA